MGAEIFTGTCGYDYLDWRGAFYPAELKREQFLTWYLQHFQVLELDYSYYQMPTREQMVGFVERSEGRLLFSVKANQTLTHKIMPSAWTMEARIFQTAVDELAEAGKLGTILFQFPFSFHYEPAQRRYLDELLKEFSAYPCVVEFRNAGWINNRVLESLQQRRVTLGATDMPNLAGLPPPTATASTALGYLRFHGRNSETWWGSDAAARFDYLYTEDELAPWADRLISLSTSTERIMVMFNNHRNAQAPHNARMFMELLNARKLQDPTP